MTNIFCVLKTLGLRRENVGHLRRCESGQALVEVALASSVIALLLIASIDFGRFAYDGVLLANGARAGVQYGAQNLTTVLDNGGMQSAAKNDAQNIAGFSATGSHFCTCALGDTATSTCLQGDCPNSHRLVYAQVAATGSFAPLFAYPGIPATISITRTAVLQVSP